MLKMLNGRFKKMIHWVLVFTFVAFISIPAQIGFADTTTYQAENATIYQGVTETVNAGYTGSSYVNYNNVTGSYVEWIVNSPLAETANLVFTYANGTTIDRPMEIKVNGVVVSSSQSFAPTGAWTTWKTVSVSASLNAGSNTIRATAITSNGGPNVDKLDLFGSYQAENATIYNGVTETVNAGYTGASYVNYNNVVGSYVEWIVNVPSACTASLEFTYANGTTVDRPMEIKVNGTVINGSQSFVPTGAWTTWRMVSINANLNAGNNTIRATATTSNGGPNVDKLDVNTSKLSSYKFDFGAGAAVAGYTKVNASLAYSASTGYGFNTPANMANVTASGTGVTADAVQFLTYGVTSINTFNVDLPNGLYQMTVTLGNTARTSVAAEGVFQIMNMTGNCVSDTIQIPVTDGQLNILATEGKTGYAFTMAALEITRISDNPTMGKTIWVGGDSTACNYYPLATSVQTGWGQMLPKYINTIKYQIRNMATSGQWARGFRDDGQFAAIMKYIKPGDLFLLEFGINDTNPTHDETEAQFKEIMRDMVQQVKATGATVVLVTPQGKATDWVDGVHTAVDRWYRHSTVALASEESVPLVDLNVLSSSYFTSIGQTATTALYMSDGLHFNHEGATQLARLVYENLVRQGLI